MSLNDPNNSLNNFFDQLTELLRTIELSKNKKVDIPQDIEERLLEIESVAGLLRTISEKTLTQLGISEEKVQQALQAKDLPPKEKRLLERSQQLSREVESNKKEISTAVTIAKQREKGLGKEGTGVRARKKKFRAIGSKKNWKPL